jgi:hypothetical protein
MKNRETLASVRPPLSAEEHRRLIHNLVLDVLSDQDIEDRIAAAKPSKSGKPPHPVLKDIRIRLR